MIVNLGRKNQRYGCPLTRLAGDFNFAVVGFHDGLAQTQAQSVTAGVLGAGFIDPVKRLKNKRELFLRDADPIICNPDNRLMGLRLY